MTSILKRCGAQDRIEARQGDLFEPVQNERFDLVTFNPPFFRGTPKSPLDMAWRGSDVLERFAERLPEALEPNGCALVVLSTDGGGAELLTVLEQNALSITVLAERSYGNEDLTAYLVKRAW